MTMTIDTPPTESRARRLRALTHDCHDRLDTAITTAACFASREGYARFVGVQFLFHRDIDALYGHARLRPILPSLAGRRQLPLLRRDLADLGVAEPMVDGAPVFVPNRIPDVPTALGWLYVAEGSRLGATLLRQEAARLGLSDDCGARHLAPASEGPAAYWRSFTAALDAVKLDTDEEARVIAGGLAAFARIQAYVDDRLR